MWRPRLPRLPRLPKKVMLVVAPLLTLGAGAYGWWHFALPPFSKTEVTSHGTSEAETKATEAHGVESTEKVAHAPPEEGGHASPAESKETGHDSGSKDDGQAHEGAEETQPSGHGAAKKEASSEVTMPDQVFAAPARSNALLTLVRELVAAQASAALGNEAKADGQREIILEVLKFAQSADPEKMTVADVQALALFALSGGPVHPLEPLAKKVRVAPSLKNMLEGAIAYGRGDQEDATKLLREQDYTKLPHPLAAMMALAQFGADSELSATEKYKRLVFAASAMPGTLVEEAALRRLTELAAESGDNDRFYALVDRYLRRFSRSAYSKEFRDVMFAGLAKLEMRSTAAPRIQLTRLMDKLPADAALELSLYLSRKALRQGNADLCQFMASHARTLAAASTEGEGQRLNLYDEACRVAGSPEPLAAHSFEEAPLSLPPEDRHLWQAVQAMNNLIWEEPTARAADEELKPTQAPDESSDQELEASVTQQLQAIEKLIAKVPR